MRSVQNCIYRPHWHFLIIVSSTHFFLQGIMTKYIRNHISQVHFTAAKISFGNPHMYLSVLAERLFFFFFLCIHKVLRAFISFSHTDHAWHCYIQNASYYQLKLITLHWDFSNQPILNSLKDWQLRLWSTLSWPSKLRSKCSQGKNHITCMLGWLFLHFNWVTCI